ncbi:McrB family protein [Intestinibacter sp.]
MAIIDSRSEAKFDALIRTNKADSLMAFIMATYKTKNLGDRREEVAKRLKSAYELYRENVKGSDSGAGSYGQGKRDINTQFESHYTMGYEMGIWQDSDFTLNQLARKVARYEITVSEYIGIVFTNLFAFYSKNGESVYHHFLYEVLKNAKSKDVIDGNIPKSIIAETLPIDKKTEQGNMIFNYLIATNFFIQVDKDNFSLAQEWKDRSDELISMCNLEYKDIPQEEAIEMAKDKQLYASYVTKIKYKELNVNLESADDIDSNDEDINIENLEDKRVITGENVLMYGVPGSGKSWTIEQEYCDSESKVERLVFHPDYTYSDFIGQILPSVDASGQVTYRFTPGPFTNIIKDAYNNPQTKYVLIIEEINRGNAPAIFGEVFQLLDRKDENSDTKDGFNIRTSEYGITHSDIARVVYGDPNHKVRIPSNLSIIGTMNTSDQNVFTLDTAFQRRWDPRLIENNFDNVDPEFAKTEILDTKVTWENFCTEINDIIVSNGVRMASAEDKRLGTYFVKQCDLIFDENMGNLSDGMYKDLCEKEKNKTITRSEKEELTNIRNAMKQNRKFPEKVIKYLWDDAFKFNREAIFEISEYKSLEQVVHAFMYSEDSARFKIFNENVRNRFTYLNN